MEPVNLVLDPAGSRVHVRTFAEGLFARLAHDLELACRDVEGEGHYAPDAGSGSATLEVPITGIYVVGVRKGAAVDEQGLSPSDKHDAIEKMRHDVFHTTAQDARVRVEASLDQGKARVRVVAPSGRSTEVTLAPRLRSEGDVVHVAGTFPVSLQALGSDVVKGPMGAFRVKDLVEIDADLAFRPLS